MPSPTQEADAAEKLHATRTAIVATKENENIKLKQDLVGLKQELAVMTNRVGARPCCVPACTPAWTSLRPCGPRS